MIRPYELTLSRRRRRPQSFDLPIEFTRFAPLASNPSASRPSCRDAPPAWFSKAVLTEEVRVQRLEFNKAPDERFDLVPRQGDLVEDLRGRF
jgi:hypothetical protein